MRFRRATKLTTTGVPGRAQVLEMSQTGMFVNNRARIQLRVRIEAPGIPPYEKQESVIVPVIALSALQPGRILPVLVDPGNPQSFEINWRGSTGGASLPVDAETEGEGGPTDEDPDLAELPRPGRHGAAAMPDSGPLSSSDHPDGYELDAGQRLSKLVALRNAGQISYEEFKEHKRRILFDI